MANRAKATLVALLIAAPAAAAITAAPASATPTHCTPDEWRTARQLCELRGTLDGWEKYADGLNREADQIERDARERAAEQRRAWMLGTLALVVVGAGGAWLVRRRVSTAPTIPSAGFNPGGQPNAHAHDDPYGEYTAPPSYAPEAEREDVPPAYADTEQEDYAAPTYVRSERVTDDPDDGDDSPFAGVV